MPVPGATEPGGATFEVTDGKGRDSGRRNVVGGVKENEVDAWWLDVLFPTNEKLGILSKPDASRGVEPLNMYIIVFREGMILHRFQTSRVTYSSTSVAHLIPRTSANAPSGSSNTSRLRLTGS
ncbi:hypothetical protein FRC12_001961, partial [Ceratobasidium sp. 428]